MTSARRAVMYTVEAPKFISGKIEINLFKYENLLVTGHWLLLKCNVVCECVK
ncbi:hypothetical protein [Scytonema hofmannii]|uniref:hypothetical protein n=1 Tax=Scytonema hofmannii TaxID=34078 RepID=UPI001314E6CF|nr:hypothetical protein [Scytonema hofmannii]